MVTPPYLRSGDSIGLVSTARKITSEELLPALTLLKQFGLKAVLGNTINARDNQYAGDDALRANDFQLMLDNPSIKAIWCARGGYGTVRIIDALDFSKFKKNPKWIIGYSDVTVLHSHVHQFGIETLHANMPSEIARKTEATRTTLKNALFGNDHEIAINIGHRLNRKGQAIGEVVGGNLSILYSLCGSPSSLNTAGKILFIEDLDEYLYHIDRMVMNLKRNGMFKDLAGLLVGGFSDIHDNSVPFGKTAQEIILEAVSEFDYPVCFDVPAGHVKDNQALIMGRKASLSVLDTGAVLKF